MTVAEALEARTTKKRRHANDLIGFPPKDGKQGSARTRRSKLLPSDATDTFRGATALCFGGGRRATAGVPRQPGSLGAVSTQGRPQGGEDCPFGFGYNPPIASAMTDKNYVLRPWTAEEDADFERFCASIGETPSDPVHARLMEDGEIDFFNVDPWWATELPRA